MVKLPVLLDTEEEVIGWLGRVVTMVAVKHSALAKVKDRQIKLF